VEEEIRRKIRQVMNRAKNEVVQDKPVHLNSDKYDQIIFDDSKPKNKTKKATGKTLLSTRRSIGAQLFTESKYKC
jgi:hypothetical protein